LPWNFYGWFVFAVVFIAAYFAWVWTSARPGNLKVKTENLKVKGKD
jgi:hypothetical protein